MKLVYTDFKLRFLFSECLKNCHLFIYLLIQTEWKLGSRTITRCEPRYKMKWTIKQKGSGLSNFIDTMIVWWKRLFKRVDEIIRIIYIDNRTVDKSIRFNWYTFSVAENMHVILTSIFQIESQLRTFLCFRVTLLQDWHPQWSENSFDVTIFIMKIQIVYAEPSRRLLVLAF